MQDPEDSPNNALSKSGILIFYLVFGPLIGTYVLVNVVKTDFSDGPFFYWVGGYLVGFVPALLAAIINLNLFLMLLKRNPNPSKLICVSVSVFSGFILSVFFYLILGFWELNFFYFSAVFCAPGLFLGLFNKGLCNNTPNKNLKRDC
jgi:glucan phosphoethanolaminetransferase (alkaline phosphatase superfamily)